jgi:hypothetical protein
MNPTCRNVKTNLEASETLRLKNLKMTSACQCHGSSAAPTCKVDASLMSFSPSCWAWRALRRMRYDQLHPKSFIPFVDRQELRKSCPCCDQQIKTWRSMEAIEILTNQNSQQIWIQWTIQSPPEEAAENTLVQHRSILVPPPKDPLESFGRHPGPWALGKAPGKKNTAAYNDATTTWYILICGKWLDTMNSQASNISPACRIKSELTTWFHHMCHGQDIASFPQFREQSTPQYTRDSYSSIFGTPFMMVGWPCPFNPLAICWPWACGPSNDIKLVASPKIFDYTPIQSSNKLPILVG